MQTAVFLARHQVLVTVIDPLVVLGLRLVQKLVVVLDLVASSLLHPGLPRAWLDNVDDVTVVFEPGHAPAVFHCQRLLVVAVEVLPSRLAHLLAKFTGLIALGNPRLGHHWTQVAVQGVFAFFQLQGRRILVGAILILLRLGHDLSAVILSIVVH